ncbi:hypothetical protein D9C73_018319 [Collichthys lucidus]|uniref:Uncharacterized protein n=1 Tax=Collichthys lucidus TaxID=240159 RepID=A0A4U5VA63_COLLU|nr:hypothetical protein D9C73_018319 [Collichthys lucidus]
MKQTRTTCITGPRVLKRNFHPVVSAPQGIRCYHVLPRMHRWTAAGKQLFDVLQAVFRPNQVLRSFKLEGPVQRFERRAEAACGIHVSVHQMPEQSSHRNKRASGEGVCFIGVLGSSRLVQQLPDRIRDLPGPPGDLYFLERVLEKRGTVFIV